MSYFIKTCRVRTTLLQKKIFLSVKLFPAPNNLYKQPDTYEYFLLLPNRFAVYPAACPKTQVLFSFMKISYRIKADKCRTDSDFIRPILSTCVCTILALKARCFHIHGMNRHENGMNRHKRQANHLRLSFYVDSCHSRSYFQLHISVFDDALLTHEF